MSWSHGTNANPHLCSIRAMHDYVLLPEAAPCQHALRDAQATPGGQPRVSGVDSWVPQRKVVVSMQDAERGKLRVAHKHVHTRRLACLAGCPLYLATRGCQPGVHIDQFRHAGAGAAHGALQPPAGLQGEQRSSGHQRGATCWAAWRSVRSTDDRMHGVARRGGPKGDCGGAAVVGVSHTSQARRGMQHGAAPGSPPAGARLAAAPAAPGCTGSTACGRTTA